MFALDGYKSMAGCMSRVGTKRQRPTQQATSAATRPTPAITASGVCQLPSKAPNMLAFTPMTTQVMGNQGLIWA